MTPEDKLLQRRARKAAKKAGEQPPLVEPVPGLREGAAEEDLTPKVIFDYEDMVPQSIADIRPFRELRGRE